MGLAEPFIVFLYALKGALPFRVGRAFVESEFSDNRSCIIRSC